MIEFALLCAAAVGAFIVMTNGEQEKQTPMPVGARSDFKKAFFLAYSHIESAGIPVGFAYAVSALETGSGSGNVFKQTNNLFSILASPSWRGETYQGKPNSLTANKGGDLHRKYPNWEASISDWIRLMRTQHYLKAYQAALRQDHKGFFQALQDAGYAGINKVYAASLSRVYAEIA